MQHLDPIAWSANDDREKYAPGPICPQCDSEAAEIDADYHICKPCLALRVSRELGRLEQLVSNEDREWLILAQELLDNG